tara:strand:+ start:1787 stop:2125 length:339 start_codon:yes stop_codon:yes gene_type:complete
MTILLPNNKENAGMDNTAEYLVRIACEELNLKLRDSLRKWVERSEVAHGLSEIETMSVLLTVLARMLAEASVAASSADSVLETLRLLTHTLEEEAASEEAAVKKEAGKPRVH